jgi:hypothetical protein
LSCRERLGKEINGGARKVPPFSYGLLDSGRTKREHHLCCRYLIALCLQDGRSSVDADGQHVHLRPVKLYSEAREMKSMFTAAVGAALLGLLALSPAHAQQKTAKQCNDEWTANKASIQASGKTRRVFVAECRGVPVVATPPASLGKGQYATEAEAKTSCSSDAVVWVNLRSKVYHAAGSKTYGKTKRGAYMCEKEATAGGFRAPKGSKPPAT